MQDISAELQSDYHAQRREDRIWMRNIPNASVQSPRRWLTRDAVMARILELERAPAHRTKTPGYVHSYCKKRNAIEKQGLRGRTARAWCN